MAETSGFFNSEKLLDGSFDRVYLADSFAKYFASFIGNGIFGGSMGTLQVILNDSYGVAVQSGQGYINGYWYENDSALSFTLAESDATSRIDSVVLRLDLFARTVSLALVTGMPSANPMPTPLVRNNSTWELRLCNINVAANATEITAVNIIDTPFDANQCGLVHGVIDQLDTTTYGNRLEGFIDNYIANVSVDYQNNFLMPLADKIAQAAVDYETNFTEPLANKLTQANSDFNAFKSEIDTLSSNANDHYNQFVPNIDSLQNLATAAYNDFLEWIGQRKIDATEQIQVLVDQLEQIIVDGDVTAIIAKVDALETAILTIQTDMESQDAEIRAQLNDKADKRIPSQIGNLAALGSDGNIVDSGSKSTSPSGNAGGDLTGEYPNPTLNVINPSNTPSATTLKYGGAFNTVSPTVDTKGRVLGVITMTNTLPPLPFNVFETEEDAEADNSGFLALFPL